jgi:hypothetical protein
MYLKFLVLLCFEPSVRLFRSLIYRTPEYEMRYTLDLLQSVWCVFQVSNLRGTELRRSVCITYGCLVCVLRFTSQISFTP